MQRGCMQRNSRKGTQKGRETCPFRALDGFNEIRLNLLMDGGDDGTRNVLHH